MGSNPQWQLSLRRLIGKLRNFFESTPRIEILSCQFECPDGHQITCKLLLILGETCIQNWTYHSESSKCLFSICTLRNWSNAINDCKLRANNKGLLAEPRDLSTAIFVDNILPHCGTSMLI